MKREIDGPEQDWLTEEEAVAYLRINTLVFRRLVEAGWIRGTRYSRECVLYAWETLACASLRLKLGEQPPELSKEKSP